MKRFADYMREQVEMSPAEAEYEPEQPEITSAAPTPMSFTQRKMKPWKATKKDSLAFWNSLSPNIPLRVNPIDAQHKGSTIQEDGLRITGSKEFIATILSRLKDLALYETEKTKLVIDYRQNAKALTPGGKDSYLFYCNIKKRS